VWWTVEVAVPVRELTWGMPEPWDDHLPNDDTGAEFKGQRESPAGEFSFRKWKCVPFCRDRGRKGIR